MVATPKRDSFSTAALSARTMLRLTTPRSFIGILMSLSLRFQRRVEPREHAPRIAFVDLFPVRRAQVHRALDVALGVVEGKTGLGIDALHRADHLAGEQDVVHRDHLGQKIDCLLYTSDAADDLLCVDLGGRRIIKK